MRVDLTTVVERDDVVDVTHVPHDALRLGQERILSKHKRLVELSDVLDELFTLGRIVHARRPLKVGKALQLGTVLAEPSFNLSQSRRREDVAYCARLVPRELPRRPFERLRDRDRVTERERRVAEPIIKRR